MVKTVHTIVDNVGMVLVIIKLDCAAAAKMDIIPQICSAKLVRDIEDVI